MFRAADGLLAEILPRAHLFRVEGAEFEAGPEDSAQADINLLLAYEALLNRLKQSIVAGTALQVGAGLDGGGAGCSGIRMGLVLALCVEVVDCTAVGNHEALEAPLVAQDVLEQAVAGAARVAFVAVVCAHHLLYLRLGDEFLEGRQVGLPEVALAD